MRLIACCSQPLTECGDAIRQMLVVHNRYYDDVDQFAVLREHLPESVCDRFEGGF